MEYKGDRPGWDEFFLELARTASLRGTCDRRRIGAVLARENRVLSIGYNGSLPGMPHCDEVGHDMVDGHCVRVVHAEQNALFHAARFGLAVEGATLYTLAYPCWLCFRALAMSGIRRVCFVEEYRPDPRVEAAAALMAIGLSRFPGKLPAVLRVREELLDQLEREQKKGG